jgi:hypothetical protein
MEPTGYYTEGLLLQVFTGPERTTRIPETVEERLAALGTGLEQKIEKREAPGADLPQRDAA